jgi:8-oxo-dGTP pyrophosphatase MutT (NUDIX family)
VLAKSAWQTHVTCEIVICELDFALHHAGRRDMPHKKLVTKILQSYWRLSRGLLLDVRACAQDGDGRILLVREAHGSGWRLPGGTVAKGETAAMAVKRWLIAEAGLEVDADPRLLSVFPGGTPLSEGDHIALYLIPSWREARSRAARAGLHLDFFSPARLPRDTDEATRGWLREAHEARTQPQVW